MKKDPTVYLHHMLDSIQWVEKATKDIDFSQFEADVPTQDVVIRRIEIIGEAVRQLEDDFKETYSNIPWQDIADMRNKLIHEYFDVDLQLVWEVVLSDIPKLKKFIEQLINHD